VSDDIWIQCDNCGRILKDAMKEAAAVTAERDLLKQENATLKRQVEVHFDLLVRVHDFLIAVVNTRISRCPDKIYTPQIRCSTADDLCAAVQEVIEGAQTERRCVMLTCDCSPNARPQVREAEVLKQRVNERLEERLFANEKGGAG
jgi:hypothetical protein